MFGFIRNAYFGCTLIIMAKVLHGNILKNNNSKIKMATLVCKRYQICSDNISSTYHFLPKNFTAMQEKTQHLMFVGQQNPISWKNFIDSCFIYMRKHPFTEVSWYPDGTATSSKVLNMVNQYLLHWAPAYVMDFVVNLTGGKPM